MSTENINKEELPKRSRKWEESEIEFLKENFCKMGGLYCSEHITDRTLESIRLKAGRLGLIRNKEDRYNLEPRRKRSEAPRGYSYCPSCDQILSVDFFYKKNSKSQYGDYLNETCRSCSKERARRSFRKNKSSSREKYYANPEKKMLQNLKGRAKANNIPFDLDISDIKIPKVCPVLGIEILPFSASDNSPSVDRFYPEKGYVKGNISIISKRANSIKYNATVEEIEKVFRWMKKTQKEM